MLKKYHLSLIILTFFLLISSVQIAEAASSILYFSPAQGNFKQGESFWITIMVDTKGESINAVAANLSYPEDKLEPLGVNTDGSAMTLWAEQTAKAGKINLAGGKPTPGFSGYQKIASIGFKVKTNSGKTILKFDSDSAILSNATNKNILSLSQSGKGSYAFKPATISSTPAIKDPPPVVNKPYQPYKKTIKDVKDSKPSDINYQIKITILSVSEEKPLIGAKVILPNSLEEDKITDQNGEVIFDNISLGEQYITVEYEDTSLHGIIEILPKEGLQEFDVKFKLPRSMKTLVIFIGAGITTFILLIIIFMYLKRKPKNPVHLGEENINL